MCPKAELEKDVFRHVIDYVGDTAHSAPGVYQVMLAHLGTAGYRARWLREHSQHPAKMA